MKLFSSCLENRNEYSESLSLYLNSKERVWLSKIHFYLSIMYTSCDIPKEVLNYTLWLISTTHNENKRKNIIKTQNIIEWLKYAILTPIETRKIRVREGIHYARMKLAFREKDSVELFYEHQKINSNSEIRIGRSGDIFIGIGWSVSYQKDNMKSLSFGIGETVKCELISNHYKFPYIFEEAYSFKMGDMIFYYNPSFPIFPISSLQYEDIRMGITFGDIKVGIENCSKLECTLVYALLDDKSGMFLTSNIIILKDDHKNDIYICANGTIVLPQGKVRNM